MSINIISNNIRREVQGSFKVGGNKDDIKNIARQLLNALDNDESIGNYIWIDIHEPLPVSGHDLVIRVWED